MFGLMRTQIGGNTVLQTLVDLVQKMHHQDVFGGNRAIGFEFEQPIPFPALLRDQGIPGRRDRIVQRRYVIEYS